MMVDTSATEERGSIVEVLHEKDEDGGFASGGWKSEESKLSCGYSSFRGKRATMEDFYDIKTSKIDGQTVCLFGVFDGCLDVWNLEFWIIVWIFNDFHLELPFIEVQLSANELYSSTGSSSSLNNVMESEDPMQLEMFSNNSDSDRLKQMALSLFQYHWFTGCGVLHGMLMQDRMLFHLLIWVCSILSGNLSKLAGETYQQTDANFLDSERETFRDDGSTASTAVLVGNHLYVANVGDSRAIISKAGKGGLLKEAAFTFSTAIPLSEDHKPNRSDERKRIESAGGVVMWAGTWRVGGVLAMSRAFGNRMLKQFVVAEPEIQDQEIDEEIELIVLASDGLWDVVPNDDAVSLAQTEEEPEAAARKLTETAFTRGSADNITCIVVKFHHERANSASPQHD
uniref:PPM-type phosphatase domain-containing protein n=1 Tax=Fagus sylvatica TaxID=28930 RepID=A0A2N9GIV1_FAGSY